MTPVGFCERCGHHESAHLVDEDGSQYCDTEVSDYGETMCVCPGFVAPASIARASKPA